PSPLRGGGSHGPWSASPLTGAAPSLALALASALVASHVRSTHVGPIQLRAAEGHRHNVIQGERQRVGRPAVRIDVPTTEPAVRFLPLGLRTQATHRGAVIATAPLRVGGRHGVTDPGST